MYLVVIALILKLMWKPRIITAIAISALGFIAAGGAAPVAMLCFLTGIVSVAMLFIKKHHAKYLLLFAATPLIVGSLINALAPGNMARKAFVETNPGNFGSVPILGVPFVSAANGFYTIFSTITISFMLVMLLNLPFMCQLLNNNRFKFKHPICVGILSIMLICALYLPIIYGNGYNIIDRYVNIVQIAIWIVGVIDTFYVLGWAVTVKRINVYAKTRHCALFLCVIAALSIGTTARIDFSAEPGGHGSFSVAAPFSAVILYEFLTGEIQAYHTAYSSLLEYMDNDEAQPPDFRNLPDIAPSIFLRPFSHSEDDDFTIEWFAMRMSNRYGKPLPIPD